MGEAAVETIDRIEKLFERSTIIVIEVYSDIIREDEVSDNRFVFISHNTNDFSHPNASKKLPHPDIELCFSLTKSYYFITLSEALQHIEPEHFDDLMIEHNWSEEPRRLTEIIEAIDEIVTKVWYNRHRCFEKRLRKVLLKLSRRRPFQ
ncbi:hypothetical protein [Paenibacillus sp. PL91]|uniref:hypothetical protein n=1 Tax=Paenibacillus sp. PL91 TaxID=2729538 RepID=UPI001CB916E4|nr:hypothetical protein [Paenibacillus sp. PL91]